MVMWKKDCFLCSFVACSLFSLLKRIKLLSHGMLRFLNSPFMNYVDVAILISKGFFRTWTWHLVWRWYHCSFTLTPWLLDAENGHCAAMLDSGARVSICGGRGPLRLWLEKKPAELCVCAPERKECATARDTLKCDNELLLLLSAFH